MSGMISETARISRCCYPDDIRLFRNVAMSDTTCETGVSIGDDTTVERCVLGKNVAINRRSYINDSIIGDYTYTGINTTINFTKVGKFCSIARNVDIGGFDHDYHKFTTMPMFRFQQMKNGEKPRLIHEGLCEIGNDVWIAAGAQVLHKVKIGDGAVVGGGAVVTRDVPPYAIVAGVPARIIKYRFSKPLIDRILNLQWWNWPEELIISNIDMIINSDVTEETITELEDIYRSVSTR